MKSVITLEVLLLFLAIAMSSPLSAQIFVDQDAGGSNNGSSWSNAYTDLQSALGVAVNGDEIWVAEGTYIPSTCNPCNNFDRLVSFELPPNVALYGGFNGTETVLEQRDWTTNFTILSGDIGVSADSTDNTFRVLVLENSTATTRVDGIIIEEGNADGSSINGTFFSGGGLYLDANPSGTANARIFNTTIRNNFAGGGGGVAIDAVLGGTVEVEFIDCHFENNRASTGSVSSSGGAILMLGNSAAQIQPQIQNCSFTNNFVGNDGAAISMTPSGNGTRLAPRIENCTFDNNESTDRGGAIWYRAVSLAEMEVVIKDCVFNNNIAGGQGGAIFARASFDVVAQDTIVNCIFSNNQSTGTSSVNDGEGGAIFLRSSQNATRTTDVLNCVFDRNFANIRGGGLSTVSYFSGSPGNNTTNVVNCTFYNNTTDGDGGAVSTDGTLGTDILNISNSIFNLDSAQLSGHEISNLNGSVGIANSNISAGVPSGVTDNGNNTDLDPQFTDPENGDLRLTACSPLIDAGDNTAVLSVMDPDPDGDVRIYNGTVDLGAYEIGVIYVDIDAVGANNGNSWADAFTSFQDGLNDARSGDQIWVAEGTYIPVSCSSCTTNDRLISFILPSGVEAYGGFNGTETALDQRNFSSNLTFLSGYIVIPIDSTDNSFRVVTSENTNDKTIFDGFIVEEGNADGSSINGTFFSGGGLYIDANPSGIGNLKIRNCTIRNNFAGGGGGMAVDAVIGGTIEMEILNCTFENNRASTGNVSSTGGAILMLGNSGAQIRPLIKGCTFNNNFVGNDGAAISMTPSGNTTVLGTVIDSCTFTNNQSTDRGGAVWYRQVSSGVTEVVIKNSTFLNNRSGGQGGAVFARTSFSTISNDTLANCYFEGNLADGTSSVNDGDGGALFLRGSQGAIRNHTILNCVFYNNQAVNNGGAVGATSTFAGNDGTLNVAFYNNTFVGNSAGLNGGSVWNDFPSGAQDEQWFNNIFWQNTDNSGSNDFGGQLDSVSFTLNILENGVPAGAGFDSGTNLDADPQFVDLANGDLRLTPCSPAVDAAGSVFPITDLIDLDGDDDTAEAVDIDLDGQIRVQDGALDLGAYEFSGTPTATMPEILTMNPPSICPGESIDLSANTPGAGESGSWTIINGSGTITPSNTAPMITVDNPSTGTLQLTWDITNPFCDFDPDTISINVVDNTPPTASCQDITVMLDVNGMSTITANDVDGGSSDDCALSSLSINVSSFDCLDIGTNSVILTVTDVGGNTSDCTASVTVMDNLPPDVVVQPVVLPLGTNGLATLSPADVIVSASDNCGIAVQNLNQTFFNCTNIGVQTVVLNVQDFNGNFDNLPVAVQIIDDLPPVPVCQDISVNLGGNGQATITASDIDNGSSDNCSIAALGIDISTFDCSNIGTNTVTLTVTDSEGLTASCTANVSVFDVTDPNAICQDITVNLDMNGMASITASDIDGGSIDNCGIVQSQIDISSFDINDLGNNSVTLTLTDAAGNTEDCMATVTVTNISAPVAVCQDITVSLDAMGMANIQAADVDGGSTAAQGIQSLMLDQTTFDCTNVGMNTVNLTVTDNAGETASCQATVTVIDDLPPIVICQDVTVSLNPNGQANLSASDIDGGSTDNCSIATSTIDITNFDCSNVGTNTVTLTVTDINGLSASCTAQVTVLDDEAPVASCQDITINLAPNGMASITASDIDGGSMDNCSIVLISIDIMDFDATDVGDNAVILTVTNPSGTTDQCTATVTVVNPNVPNAICQDITVQLNAMGMANITPTDVDGGSNASAGIQGLSIDQNSFDCSSVGANAVVLTVIDNLGSSASCTANVTVEDNSLPQLMCPQDVFSNNCAGQIAIPIPSFTSVCGIQSLTNDFNGSGDASDQYPEGTTAVTWTLLDVNGQSVQCMFNVTVGNTLQTFLPDGSVACNGDTDGTLMVTASGGTPPFTYLWDDPNNQVTPTATGLSAGTYSVTVLDAFGCSQMETATLNEPMALALVIDETPISCSDSCAGALQAVVAGGTPPYTYQWPDGGTTESISGLCDGTYAVTVIDNNACSISQSVTLVEPLPILVDFQSVDASCGVSGGAITAIPNQGSPPYTYQWSNGSTDANILDLLPGNYQLTLLDANGCTAFGFEDIVAIGELTTSLIGMDVSCTGANDGSVQVDVPSPDFFYIWSNGQIGPSITGLSPGSYSVSVSDPFAGCTDIASIQISEPAAIQVRKLQMIVRLFPATVAVQHNKDTLNLSFTRNQT
ncbi:MAG: choice-of-anchor Q domain-containing protein, partial [Bacteroidota bacterium]